jgi:hypothetical protein
MAKKMSSRDEMIAEIRQLNLDIAFAKRNGNKEERDCLILKKAELLKKLAIYDSKMYKEK